MMVIAKKVLEKCLSFFLKDGGVGGPDTVGQLKLMNSVSFPSDDGLSMEKSAIFVTEFNPFLP